MEKKSGRINLSCTREEQKRIKVFATLNDMSISDFVMDCVRERLSAEKSSIPNEETRRALEESARGEGVKSYEKLEDLFDDLEI